jgi:NADH dehydrogenase [ubiquinone] 1 alpha subcomplex assembly factor 5
MSLRHVRHFASQSSSGGMPAIFNRRVKELQRTRAVAEADANRESDYLKDEVANRIVDRLLFLKRDFEHLVDLGGGNGHIARSLAAERGQDTDTLKQRIKRLTVTDLSLPLATRDEVSRYNGLSVERQCVDEESLPFAEKSIDAIVSNLALHWVNDLPGALIQIRRSLVPDGAFLGSMFGGDTLFELRTSLQLAESERHGGIAPRVSPMTDVKDVGSLLNRAGFKLTTIDVEDIVVDYPDLFSLLADLHAMGESNAVFARPAGPISRDTLLAAQAIYRELHGNPDGTLPATFSVLFMIGWAPGGATPKPQPRGSGQASLKDTLEQLKDPKDAGKK